MDGDFETFLPFQMFMDAARARTARKKGERPPTACQDAQVFLGVGYRLLGESFLNHLKEDSNSLFCVPSINTLKTSILSKAGLTEAQTAPGIMPLMVKEAKATFGDAPVVLAFDERKIETARKATIATDSSKNNLGREFYCLKRLTNKITEVKGLLGRGSEILLSVAKAVLDPPPIISIKPGNPAVEPRNVKQRSEEWFSLREGYISSSDLAGLFGFFGLAKAKTIEAEIRKIFPPVQGNISISDIEVDNLDGKTGAQLKDILRDLSLAVSGKKEVLKNRIREHVEKTNKQGDNNEEDQHIESDPDLPGCSGKGFCLVNRCTRYQGSNSVSFLYQGSLPRLGKSGEEGLATHDFMASSGDGSLVRPDNPDEIVEIKCPVQQVLQKTPKPCYVAQMLAQSICYKKLTFFLNLIKLEHVMGVTPVVTSRSSEFDQA
eukprot:sb/3464860/